MLYTLGDQLDREHPGHARLERSRDITLFIEVCVEAEYAHWHRQRTTLVLSAMQHHAHWLIQCRLHLRFITPEDRDNT